MSDIAYQAETLVIGAGLAGICTALELLNNGRAVLLLDGCERQRFGGQAKEAFGGMLLSNTPEQRRNGIADSSELFWQDWQQAAQFQPDSQWASAGLRLIASAIVVRFMIGCRATALAFFR